MFDLLDNLFGGDNVLDEAIVWRIEFRNGDGPYHISIYNEASARVKFPWVFKEEQRWYHPLPSTEPGIKKRFASMKKDSIEDDVFGFPSVEAYIKWFNKPQWRRSLETAGFQLVKYRATRVAMGETQCIFSRKEAQKLAEYSPTEFDPQFGNSWDIR